MPRLSDTTVIKIQVTDINDNAPTFLPSEAVEIAENSLPGTIVTRISVHDVDLNPAFTFSFVKENNSGTKFAIDRNTGVVVLVETLDFEEATKYELQIQISDLLHQTEGTLIVHVLDINDNPPVFSQDSYQVTISELVPLGHPVLTVVATDVESSENITYRILSSSKMFSVDPTNGELFVVALAFIVTKHTPRPHFRCCNTEGAMPGTGTEEDAPHFRCCNTGRLPGGGAMPGTGTEELAPQTHAREGERFWNGHRSPVGTELRLPLWRRSGQTQPAQRQVTGWSSLETGAVSGAGLRCRWFAQLGAAVAA
ncbi:protocadherin-23-like [Cervus canadensis]|uniref:protocadherin-23-like n=1 Tax=Cervus canadensis TaxID=1574408 RepID=UPI001C9E6F9D|nr:protocadherin-23-like [Cervus canadensis]